MFGVDHTHLAIDVDRVRDLLGASFVHPGEVMEDLEACLWFVREVCLLAQDIGQVDPALFIPVEALEGADGVHGHVVHLEQPGPCLDRLLRAIELALFELTDAAKERHAAIGIDKTGLRAQVLGELLPIRDVRIQLLERGVGLGVAVVDLERGLVGIDRLLAAVELFGEQLTAALVERRGDKGIVGAPGGLGVGDDHIFHAAELVTELLEQLAALALIRHQQNSLAGALEGARVIHHVCAVLFAEFIEQFDALEGVLGEAQTNLEDLDKLRVIALVAVELLELERDVEAKGCLRVILGDHAIEAV